jgi:myo-inositol 2-dehydrogenase/D-chiro-inositol 1-dehydrogenase
MPASVRISLIGLGRAGGFHLASVGALDSVTLAQVYDTDAARAAEVAGRTDCRVAGSIEEATRADDVDAIVVATPTQTHFEIVQAALLAGKPVLSEKPLGSTLVEIDTCFEAAKARGLPLFVAFQRRFDPTFAAAISAARNGELGEIRFIRSVSRDHPIPALDYLASSGGILHDCVVHDFDLVCQIAGEEPSELFCYATNRIPAIRDIGDLDHLVVSLKFPSGLLASIDVSRFGAHGYDQRVEVLGERGMLETRNPPETSATFSDRAGTKRAPIDYSFPTRYRDAYRLEFERFLACVRGERESPTTHAQVRLNHLLADAAMISVREQRPVQIDEAS